MKAEQSLNKNKNQSPTHHANQCIILESNQHKPKSLYKQC